MKVAKQIACGLVVAAGLAGAAQAQGVGYDQYLPTQGTKEVGIGGSFQWEPVDSQNLTARLGYFFDPRIEVGLDGAYTRVSNNGVDRVWSLGVFGNYHFPGSSALLPYVGLFAGMTDSSSGTTNSSLGAQGGAKYFFNPNVAGFAELRWRNVDRGSDQTGVFFGLSVFFK